MHQSHILLSEHRILRVLGKDHGSIYFKTLKNHCVFINDSVQYIYTEGQVEGLPFSPG